MKYIFLASLWLIVGCSSDPKKQDWDSGASRENAFQEEGMNERESSAKDQMPEITTPGTNQSPSK
jgi:hypothetical protein